MDRNAEDRKELEAQLIQKQKEAQEFQFSETTKYQKQEAELYLETYRRVSPEIANYAQEHGINLVVHHQIDPPNPNDPYAAWQTLNRVVLYENKLDITEEIIAAVAEQSS
jgi:Skp family chaperone for outer membrane proteins